LSDEEKLIVAQEKRGKKVPTDEQKATLLEQAHAAGHFGEKAMYNIIEKKGFWWPLMRTDISDTIKDCRACARYNVSRSGFHPSRSVTATLPADHFQIDLAELPESLEGHNYLLVVVDVFTGFVMLKPLVNKEASTVARALWEICCVIGLPRILQSDNGSEFSNKIINCLCRLTGVHRRFIAPYNPRADGKVERAVKTIKQTIVKLLHGASALWHLYVPFVQLVYNNKVQDLTGSTPFSLMFSREMNELRDYSHTVPQPVDVNEWKEHQEKVISLIFPSISERISRKQTKMRSRLDSLRKKVTADELSPGTVVMIKDPLYLLHPSLRPSTEPEYIGPYTIVRRTLYGPYILRDDTGAIHHRQVNIDQMKVLFNSEKVSDKLEVDPQSYEVDHVMSHRENEGEYEYRVRWKGYTSKDDSWVTEEAFNDPQPVERYWKLQVAKQKAKRVSVSVLQSPAVSSLIVSLTIASPQ
jgi:transposase InsO family protein